MCGKFCNKKIKGTRETVRITVSRAYFGNTSKIDPLGITGT
jgi:hypothetical protein